MDTGSQTGELQQTGCIDPVFVTIIPLQGAAYSVSRISPSVCPIVCPLAQHNNGMGLCWSVLFTPSGRTSVLKVRPKGKGSGEWRRDELS